MLRLPNFFLVVFVKPTAMRLPLVFALPLFLVDELLEIAEAAYWLFGRKRVPRKWRDSASRAVASLRQIWRKTRRAGAFTLVDVEARDVRVWVRLL
jgi:hypothetical protein